MSDVIGGGLRIKGAASRVVNPSFLVSNDAPSAGPKSPKSPACDSLNDSDSIGSLTPPSSPAISTTGTNLSSATGTTWSSNNNTTTSSRSITSTSSTGSWSHDALPHAHAKHPRVQATSRTFTKQPKRGSARSLNAKPRTSPSSPSTSSPRQVQQEPSRAHQASDHSQAGQANNNQTTPPLGSGTHRRRPSAHLNVEGGVGVDPHELVGKVLTFARRSRLHPSLTLGFDDGTSFRVMVVGYDPAHRGVPKVLEMDEPFCTLLDINEQADDSQARRDDGNGGLELLENSNFQPGVPAQQPQTRFPLLVSDCKIVTLTDKAFALDQDCSSTPNPNLGESLEQFQPHQQRWDQNHNGLAFKFGKDKIWHCVWATLAEYNEQLGVCIFRSYHDVYLEQTKPRSHHNHHNRHKPRKSSRVQDHQ